MIPRLSHFEEAGALRFFVTTSGVVGTVVRLSLLDVESCDYQDRLSRLSDWMRELSPRVRVRLIRSLRQGKGVPFSGARDLALMEVGCLDQDLLMTVEISRDLRSFLVPSWRKGLLVGEGEKQEVLGETLKSLAGRGFTFSPLSESLVSELFLSSSHYRAGTSFIDTGTECLGVIRLLNQPVHAIAPDFWAERVSKLPLGLKISTSFRRIDPARREILLQSRLRQASSGMNILDQKREDDVGEALKASTFEGAELFEMETLILCSGESEADLKTKMAKTCDALQGFGGLAIETFGCVPSFIAGQVGAGFHVPIFEFDQGLMSYLPISAMGSALYDLDSSPSALILHRKDRSLFALDLLSKKHTNANALIVGRSGRGKSVLTSLLTQSLLNDPNVSVIKVDVGGSHSRECEILRGTEFAFSLNQPSGLNPFELAKHNDSEAVRAILGKFIEVLVLSDGETKAPKEVAVEIDEYLQKFLLSHDARSLEAFHSFAKGFSRAKLLSRWVGRGLYRNAFAAKAGCGGPEGRSSTQTPRAVELRVDDPTHPARTREVQWSVGDGPPPEHRLRYYNFSQIFEAGDPDFAQGGMAAVLAQFNLELLSHPERRLVLICDETPFFIERCFEFFKFSQANVRKFGASVVLVVQLSSHLLKNGDSSLIDNAHHRLLFSSDGEPTKYAERFGIDESKLQEIENLSSNPSSGSRFGFQSGSEFRTLDVLLSRKEYWQTTSSHSDRQMLEGLKAANLNLSTESAMEICVQLMKSRSGERNPAKERGSG